MRRQASEELLRIARDLHDMVAHNISVINVQANTALHLKDQQGLAGAGHHPSREQAGAGGAAAAWDAIGQPYPHGWREYPWR